MSHGDNHDLLFAGTVEDVERESLKDQLTCSVISYWIARGSFRNSQHGIIEGVSKSGGA
jgi:hypothetical protein